MLEVVIPIPVANSSLLPDCLASIEQHTNFPYSIIAIVDGGLREDFQDAERALIEQPQNWRLLHNRDPVYLNRSIVEAVDCVSDPMIALVAPQVRVADDDWFGKMKMVMDRDPRCVMVDTAPGARSSTMTPTRRLYGKPSLGGCRFALLRSSFAKSVPVVGNVDPVQYWHTQAHGMGNTVWHHASVRYQQVDHKEHRLWRAPSAAPTSDE